MLSTNCYVTSSEETRETVIIDPGFDNQLEAKVVIKIRFKKREQQLPIPPLKPIPKGPKSVGKYPLYEPFAHVVIVQNPKTGEHKYILDELQLDPPERRAPINVYSTIFQPFYEHLIQRKRFINMAKNY